MLEKLRNINKLKLFNILQIINLFLAAMILAVFCIAGEKFILNSQTGFLKINTKKSTVNDILGSFEIDSSSSSASEASTALSNFNSTLTDIKENATFKKFNLARVFSIHDVLILGANGWVCYSDNSSKDDLKTSKGSGNFCPTNDFTKCLGINSEDSDIEAFQKINTAYLKSTTSLSDDDITQLSSDWDLIYQNSVPSSRRLNLSKGTIQKLVKYACDNDYEDLDIDHSKLSASTIAAVGIAGAALTLVAFVLSILTTVFGFYTPALELPKYGFWLLGFILAIVPFSLAFIYVDPVIKNIKLDFEGITANGKTVLIMSFISVLNFYLVVLFTFVMLYRYHHGPGSIVSEPRRNNRRSIISDPPYKGSYA